MHKLLGTLTFLVLTGLPSLRAAEQPVAPSIDRLLSEHWQNEKLTPAGPADKATLYRRVRLDLTGRVPTVQEMESFKTEPFDATIRRLMESPEFAWYFATVLDEMVQGPLAGNQGFIDYLRASIKANKRWDVIFREVMLGPWDNDERKPATAFLDRRTKDIDALTTDLTRAFFGVDISCARCHNHPLVKDWKQEHYYGMAAFLVRTTGGKGSVSEKADGDAKYSGKDGKERVAPMMFLSGRVVTEPAEKPKGTKYSRREQLVTVALEEKKFFSRAFVNRTWEYFFGRGLVDPVDQIHSGNPASVPALLDWLADDFAQNGYDVQRLIAGIVTSKAYRLDNRWTASKTVPDAKHFAVARLRPLSPRQMAMSWVMVVDDGKLTPTPENLQAAEKQIAELLKLLDPRTREFQSSAREALFLSNSETIQKIVRNDSKGVIARLSAIRDDRELAKAAFAATLGRAPTAKELDTVTRYLSSGNQNRQEVCEDLVWALLASAEFRFNH